MDHYQVVAACLHPLTEEDSTDELEVDIDWLVAKKKEGEYDISLRQDLKQLPSSWRDDELTDRRWPADGKRVRYVQ